MSETNIDKNFERAALDEEKLMDDYFDDPKFWELNKKVFMALCSVESDAKDAIVALLRSNDPIHQTVRNALADALEHKNYSDLAQKDFVRINVHEARSNFAQLISKREQWFETGKQHSNNLNNEMSERESIALLMDGPPARGRKFVEASITYFNKFNDYIDDQSDPFFENLDSETIQVAERMYHNYRIENPEGYKSKKK